jgi:hypothetical protein
MRKHFMAALGQHAVQQLGPLPVAAWVLGRIHLLVYCDSCFHRVESTRRLCMSVSNFRDCRHFRDIHVLLLPPVGALRRLPSASSPTTPVRCRPAWDKKPACGNQEQAERSMPAHSRASPVPSVGGRSIKSVKNKASGSLRLKLEFQHVLAGFMPPVESVYQAYSAAQV